MDISSLGLQELLELQENVEARIVEIKEEEKQKFIIELREKAELLDIPVEELLRAMKGKKAKKSVEAKYRNPENDKETWTGRGRKPKWIEALLAGGGDLESVTI